jgi:hypothetical protein
MIPLPATNSTPAKRMRAVAGLVVYAKALQEFVFQPTYLSVGNDMGPALSALLAVNPEQDAFVRAALLKALPDHQKKCRDGCAKRVVECVLAAVSGLVPADEHETFKSQLTQLTSGLCVKWQHVQRLQERVEPSFTLDALDGWKPLPALPILPAANNGVTVTPPPRSGGKGHHPGPQEMERALLTTADVVKVVWPAFVATGLEQPADEEDGPSDLVHHGYVLTRAEIQDAANEEMPRRVMRRTIREANPATQKKKRDSGIFYLKERPMDRTSNSSSSIGNTILASFVTCKGLETSEMTAGLL